VTAICSAAVNLRIFLQTHEVAAVCARQPSLTITQAMEVLSGTFGGVVVGATVGSAVGGAADAATAQSAVRDAVVGCVHGDNAAMVRRSQEEPSAWCTRSIVESVSAPTSTTGGGGGRGGLQAPPPPPMATSPPLTGGGGGGGAPLPPPWLWTVGADKFPHRRVAIHTRRAGADNVSSGDGDRHRQRHPNPYRVDGPVAVAPRWPAHAAAVGKQCCPNGPLCLSFLFGIVTVTVQAGIPNALNKTQKTDASSLLLSRKTALRILDEARHRHDHPMT